MSNITRRNFVKLTGGVAAVGLAGGIGFPNIARGAMRKVVVIGGGYGGAVAAKYIKMGDHSIDVTLIEKEKEYYSCPLSNPVLIGARDLSVQKWGYEGLKKHGINVVHDEVTAIDPAAKKVTTKSGQTFDYERCVVSPGVEFKAGTIEGWTLEVAEKIPHAWKAGPQTTKLKEMLAKMNDGDPFIITVPPNPYRCPPGPYERASLVAGYLMKNKPKSKVIILDSNDKMAKQGLFKGGWEELKLPIEWVPGSEGGKVTKVDAASMTVFTEMSEFKSSAINIIPAQTAGHIAHVAALVSDKGWCPVDWVTMESTKHPGIHVIGDSVGAHPNPGEGVAPMPKSGYSANSQAKVAAAAIVAMMNGGKPGSPSYVNTCYSLISPDYGISIAAVWQLEGDKLVFGGGGKGHGMSPPKASAAYRKQEAIYAESWYQSIMADTFS